MMGLCALCEHAPGNWAYLTGAATVRRVTRLCDTCAELVAAVDAAFAETARAQ